MSPSAFQDIADIWMVSTYVIFLFIILPFFLHDPILALTRFLWCMSYAFGLRALTVLVTRYPRLPFDGPNYVLKSNLVWGSILIMLGIRTTMTDMMFSGHTVGWVMMASFVSRYSKYAWWTYIFWLFCLVGIFLLLGVREHYTADVLVAIAVAKLIFWVYHLALDDEYMDFVRPGVFLEAAPRERGPYKMPQNIKFALPATLVDSFGKKLPIVAERPGLRHEKNMLVVDNTVLRKGRTKAREVGFALVNTGENYIWPRNSIYKAFKWLDGTLYDKYWDRSCKKRKK